MVAVDGVAVAPDADEGILYGPPGSVVTLTVQKAPPDGRVLELLLTRQSATAAVQDTYKPSELDRDVRVVEGAADDEGGADDGDTEILVREHEASAPPEATSERASGVESTASPLPASSNPLPAPEHFSATATAPAESTEIPSSESTDIHPDPETTSQVASSSESDQPAAAAPASVPAAAEETAETAKGQDATPAGGGDAKEVVGVEGGASKSKKRGSKKKR